MSFYKDLINYVSLLAETFFFVSFQTLAEWEKKNYGRCVMSTATFETFIVVAKSTFALFRLLCLFVVVFVLMQYMSRTHVAA
jgi:hypothetical protein